jgi:hypothetical protein
MDTGHVAWLKKLNQFFLFIAIFVAMTSSFYYVTEKSDIQWDFLAIQFHFYCINKWFDIK